MFETLKPTKTVFTVSQFLDWQRRKVLVLEPIFQRRHVWKTPAKSQLIDSVVRGFPIPIIFLRQVQDLNSLSMNMEVVDGQQRLRTLLAFLDPPSLPDFEEQKDRFTVSRAHNTSIAGLPFAKLPAEIKHAILGYELSTHVFPATTGDDLIFRIFALLNSTGLRLSKQEIRNAEFHGAFKSLVYDLSFQYLYLWRKWRVFSDDAVSRMDEAEAVSEYLLAMLSGIAGKSQAAISQCYKKYEENLPSADILRRRFEATLLAIDDAIGDLIAGSAFQRAALFYSLFAAVYDHLYGLGGQLRSGRPRGLPDGFLKAFSQVNKKIRAKDLPDKVQDAIDRATADRARRIVRYSYLMKELNLASAR